LVSSIYALRTVAGQTSLNMPKELLEALRTVAGQTSLNMSKELLEALRTVILKPYTGK
jgi:hypothetical protein